MKSRTTQFLLTFVLILVGGQFTWSLLAGGRAQAEAANQIPEVLRARNLELVDERGQVRAQFKVEPSGEVVLRMRDTKGTIRVKLGASENGAGLLLLDERTEPGVHLLATSDGTKMTLSEQGKEQRVIEP